jgi:hypothetical protein
VRRVGPACGELGQLGQIIGEDSNGIDFRISNEFEIWQGFEEFYKEI